MIDGQEVTGTALVLAAAPVGKGRLTDAVSVLPVLAAVPPGALTGTAVASLVELADPLDPQTVLTRLRAAAASPGPLTVCIAGQLQLDHKQRLPHLALARSSAATLRYTGLPWHWLAGELKLRRPGTTTVLVDLVADGETWQHLTGDGSPPSRGAAPAGGPGRVLALGWGIRLYGWIQPPPVRRTTTAPAYLKSCAAIWRSGSRPPLATLHQQALERTGVDGELLLAVDTTPEVVPVAVPTTVPSAVPTTVPAAAPVAAPATAAVRPVPSSGPASGTPDPHPAILDAARAGHHGEAAAAAAAWEEQALRAYGPGSPQAIHWLEVRADLARLADDPATSCQLWMTAAHARLERQQPTDAPDVEGAVDRAHHQWERLRDPEAAMALAPALVALRRRVPGRQRGALLAVQRRLERWHTPATPSH
ncbi:hypothetical protein [Streptomyces sp. NPDC047886]|uniref:hypothetical protein n=1 Tax=Streptomyces sp. NPDC047886 TaxID=3365490 RepID=UPI0037237A1D